MHFGARGLVLDFFSFVNFGTIFTIARQLFEPRIFFDKIVLGKGVVKMKGSNFVVGDFFIAISLLVAFSHQSKNVEILRCF